MSAYPMIPVESAVKAVMELALPRAGSRPSERVPLSLAHGRVLASAALARSDVPAFDASTMDGYAVVSADGAGEFPVLGSSLAGARDPPREVRSGGVAYVATGAPIPPGADAVVMVEDTAPCPGGERVRVLRAADKGQFVRRAGVDMRAGDEVLPAGTLLGPAELGVLAAAGVAEPEVAARPRVAVLSTGDEVAEPSEEALAPGRVRDSNRVMLLAAAREAGAEAVDGGIAADAEEGLERRLLALAGECDAVVTTGGVSMGARDLVKPLLERRGRVAFGRMLMKPGKPSTVGTLEGALVFALPGNPVSGLVCFHLLAAPALRVMGGRPAAEAHAPVVGVRLAQSLRLDAVRPEYHRAAVYWDEARACHVAFSTGAQASHRLLSAAGANALVMLPRGDGVARAGSAARAMLIGAVRPGPPPALPPAADPPAASHSCVHHGSGRGRGRGQARPPRELRVAVLTVSDRVSRGEMEDRSGPAIVRHLEACDAVRATVVRAAVVPDDREAIAAAVSAWARSEEDRIQLVLTTGGTGFAPRDVTPEAVRPLLEREAPGLITATTVASLAILPQAMLSRGVAGFVGRALVVTLPGSPKAVVEHLDVLMRAVPHGIALQWEDEGESERH